MQALGQAVKPVENARYEAYQMRMQGRHYNTNVAADNTNTNHALESMLRPEVLIQLFLLQNVQCRSIHEFNNTNKYDICQICMRE